MGSSTTTALDFYLKTPQSGRDGNGLPTFGQLERVNISLLIQQ